MADASKVVKTAKPPNAGKGRVKGVPNKVTGELKAMILQALDEAGGVGYLKTQATTSPAAFMALVGKVLPMQVNADVKATVTEIKRSLVRPPHPNG